MVVTVTPAPTAPRKAMGNSGMLGSTRHSTSPLLAPCLRSAEPKVLASCLALE